MAASGSILGNAVKRVEDPTLLTGEGKYVDDIQETGMLHVAFVRSPIAHGDIQSIDLGDAASMPGVVAVYSGDDLGLPSMQFFPMMPISRLGERPDRRAILADITCDSDGQIEAYIDQEGGISRTLPVHKLGSEDIYYIGAFLVGAYQETLGDLHNLFGDAHAVHIRIDENGWAIDELIRGDSVRQVLSYVQYDASDLARRLEKECEAGVRAGSLTVLEAKTMRRFYESGLEGYTYLDPEIELT